MYAQRVLSGMRPTGALHLGHYHGVLKNWARLQFEYTCLYFVADWHALTTHYDEVSVIGQNTREMVIDCWPPGSIPRRRCCSCRAGCRSMPSCTCCCR